MKRAYSVLADLLVDDDDVSLLEAVKEVDDKVKKDRKSRRGGWGGLRPRRLGSNGGTYLERYRYRYWESQIWKDLQAAESYNMGHNEFGRTFRNEYLVPRIIFDRMVVEAGQIPELTVKEPLAHRSEDVRPWAKKGTTGVPLKHKLACFLYKWRNNVPWKTVKKLGGVEETALRRWSKKFLKLYVKKYLAKYVHPPSSQEELDQNLTKHAKCGSPGCLAMYDGVPVEWLNCPTGDVWKHKGKEGYPVRRFLVAGNINRFVFECTRGFHGVTNDLTMCHFSKLMASTRSGVYSRMEFTVYDSNGKQITVRGLWNIVDNGIHRWRCNQPPSKHTVNIWDQRWSKRVESQRKPGSECIFGIVKKRIPALDVGVRASNPEEISDLMQFACIVHNRLLSYDDLHTIGEYEGDYINVGSLPIDDTRIHAQQQVRDQSVPHLPDPRAEALNVRKNELEPGWLELRNILVMHYKTMWLKREVCWLRTAEQCRGLRYDPRPRLRRGEGHVPFPDADDGTAAADEEEILFEESDEESEEEAEEEADNNSDDDDAEF